MKLSRVCYTVVVSLFAFAALFAASSVTPTRAARCDSCDPVESTGAILATHNPNAFETYTMTVCDQSVPIGVCGWSERMLILKWSPRLRDWVRVSDTTVPVVGYCGQGQINYHGTTYPVGTGLYDATLDVIDRHGTRIDTTTIQITF